MLRVHPGANVSARRAASSNEERLPIDRLAILLGERFSKNFTEFRVASHICSMLFGTIIENLTCALQSSFEACIQVLLELRVCQEVCVRPTFDEVLGLSDLRFLGCRFTHGCWNESFKNAREKVQRKLSRKDSLE